MIYSKVSRRRLTTTISALMFALGALLVSIAPGVASAGTQLSTGSGGSAVGGSFTTTSTVALAAPDELNGFDVTLSYNASVAVPTNVALSGAWTIPLDPGTIGPGTIHIAASRLGFCTGSCPLFTISWTAVGSGSFSLTPTAYTLTGRQSGVLGNLTQTSPDAGTVAVTSPQQSTPTNTAVPPTNTSVPTASTSTSVPPTNTPATTTTPVTPVGTPPTSTTTQVAQPSLTPTVPGPVSSPEATGTSGVAAPAAPAVVIETPIPRAPAVPSSPGTIDPTPDLSSLAVPSASSIPPTAPRPGGGQSASAPTAGQLIPLPPRAGDSLASAPRSPLKQLGLALMVVSGIVFAAGWAGFWTGPTGFSDALDDYLEDVESAARKR